jgi:uncharacterized Tic20 family protein
MPYLMVRKILLGLNFDMTKTTFFMVCLGATFVVAVGVFLAKTFPDNTAPIITATANLFGITVSVCIIIWQVSKQHLNILKQQEKKFRDELLLDIYRELDKERA